MYLPWILQIKSRFGIDRKKYQIYTKLYQVKSTRRIRSVRGTGRNRTNIGNRTTGVKKGHRTNRKNQDKQGEWESGKNIGNRTNRTDMGNRTDQVKQGGNRTHIGSRTTRVKKGEMKKQHKQWIWRNRTNSRYDETGQTVDMTKQDKQRIWRNRTNSGYD